MTYTLEIAESQRLALIELLKTEMGRALCESASLDGQSDDPALVYWDTMLAELPAIESEFPGIVHGFCL